jgi:flagellar hook-associated protein 3 FlgL
MLNRLNQVTAAENEAMREVSTSRKLNLPSDDPAGMAMLIVNQAAQSVCDQYVQNITTVRSSLQTADSSLSSVISALTRAVTLGVEGANGTLSTANRSAIADEISGVRQEILSLANGTFNGSYIFAGAKTNTPPFVLDGSSPSGVSYQGDSTINQVAIADGSTIAANKPGDALFTTGTNVFGALQDLLTALQSGGGIETATSAVREALDQVSAQRVSYGTSIRQLDAESGFQSSSKLQLQSQENNLSGVDMADAISRLTNAENARNATLAAASRIGQTSLIDYLR